MNSEILNLVQEFKPVSLEEMDKLSLMSRSDTKFIFHESRLPELLKTVLDNYQVLEIKGVRLMPYNSVYFDTEDMHFYNCHHNGRLNRYKVRIRNYLVSDISFFEIKKKTNQERTRKKRIPVPFCSSIIGTEENDFLKKHTDISGDKLKPVLDNEFIRITLAGFASMERVTIDLELKYRSNGIERHFPGLVITEVKRGKGGEDSPFVGALKNARIFPKGFSKYCIGIVSTKNNVKHNNFKPKLRLINKKIYGTITSI